MNNKAVINAINTRYSNLADKKCCISCGSAVTYSDASKGEICVDLGSGKGFDAFKLSKTVGPSGYVYGIDLSDGMIKKALQKKNQLAIKNVEFLKSNLESLPLADQSVDLIISNCTINHVENKQNVWNEIFRCLKKGGRFVISDIYAFSSVPKEYQKDPKSISECWGGAVVRNEYLSQLKKAGFDTFQILEESNPYDKGPIQVVSWTLLGFRPKCCCNC